jgi:hypothetical protein
MKHPLIIQAESELKHQQYLQEAEIERLYREIKQHRPSLSGRRGDLLIMIGQKRQTHPSAGSTASALDTK